MAIIDCQGMVMSFVLDWYEDRHSVEYWLHRTAQKNLSGLEWGVAPGVPQVAERVMEDDFLKMAYMLDLGTFVHGEEIALYACSAAINFAPDEKCQSFLATQVLDEARHREVFNRRLDDIGLSKLEKATLLDRCMTPSVRAFHDLVKEQVDKKDFMAATIALNLILEGMAYPVYSYEVKYWSRLDPALSEVIRGAFQDEVQHVAFGEALTRSMVNESVENKNRASALISQFASIVSEIFDESRQNYVKLYQEAARPYADLIGDIEIFPGHRMADTSADEQVLLLKEQTNREFNRRIARIGI